MKKPILFFLFLAVQAVLFAQEYYPEGTRWTEIRLDTLKYNNWYSKVGDEWIQNFETIEYYVQGEYVEKNWDNLNTFKKVYTNGPEWADSITYLIQETEYNGHKSVLISVLSHKPDGNYIMRRGEVYQFDWRVGKGIYYQDIVQEQTTYSVRYRFYYGIIDEIKEGYFGGVRPLKYVDLDGKALDDDGNIKNVETKGAHIIQGIGITEWDDGECLLGPPNPYFALSMFDPGGVYPERHYRSMLVHFERNGEVLYDVWPEKEATNEIKVTRKDKKNTTNTLYHLKGHKLQEAPQKGIYIQNGKIKLSK